MFPAMTDRHAELDTLAAARWRIAVALTAAMIAIYFGFIALIAYNKPFLSRLIVPGLTVGIAMGALVIVASWVLTYVYVRWANKHYDVKLADLQQRSVDARR
jgi:uncharacterized membrane protein (DUF485 family)